jgi:hypothetical protein
VTVLTLVVCLAARYDAGNEPRVTKLLDLNSEVRRALDGERRRSHERAPQ